MDTRLNYLRLISVCFLVLWGSVWFRAHTSTACSAQNAPVSSEELYNIQPLKEHSALASGTITASAPQVISLRTQQQVQQQAQGKHLELHGIRPKNTAKPRQANKDTVTFCRKNIYPVDYFVYFLQEIIV